MHHEPDDSTRIQCNWEVWQIFVNAGWDVYLDRINGWDEEITLEFALNLEEGVSRVRGLEIPVTEETIVEVSGIPQGGE